MKDVFYTLLFVWIVYRILNAFGSTKSESKTYPPPSSPKSQSIKDETTVSSSPKKKSFGDNEGEYVDFEEMK